MSTGYMRRCAGKKRHDDRQGAIGERKSIEAGNKLARGKVTVYRCDQCMGWHVGGTGNTYITRKRRSGKRPNKRMRGRV